MEKKFCWNCSQQAFDRTPPFTVWLRESEGLGVQHIHTQLSQTCIENSLSLWQQIKILFVVKIQWLLRQQLPLFPTNSVEIQIQENPTHSMTNNMKRTSTATIQNSYMKTNVKNSIKTHSKMNTHKKNGDTGTKYLTSKFTNK